MPWILNYWNFNTMCQNLPVTVYSGRQHWNISNAPIWIWESGPKMSLLFKRRMLFMRNWNKFLHILILWHQKSKTHGGTFLDTTEHVWLSWSIAQPVCNSVQLSSPLYLAFIFHFQLKWSHPMTTIIKKVCSLVRKANISCAIPTWPIVMAV